MADATPLRPAMLTDVAVAVLPGLVGAEGVAVADPEPLDVVVELVEEVLFRAAQIFAGNAPKAIISSY